MKRFSAQAEQTLRDAGWYPGRQVPDLVASWEARLAASGFEMFPSARRALLEFGGLEIDQRAPGVNCAREPFNFHPLLASWENDRFEDYANLLNTKLYPLGEAVGSHSFWAIGENEQVYLIMDEAKFLGNNLDEALENLLIGNRALNQDSLTWLGVEADYNGRPLFFRLRQFPIQFPTVLYPQRLNVFWTMSEPDWNGLPTDQESERLETFEDRLIDAVELDEQSILAGVLTSNGEREFIFHTADPAEFLRRLTTMPQEPERYPITIESYEDPDWAYFKSVVSQVG